LGTWQAFALYRLFYRAGKYHQDKFHVIVFELATFSFSQTHDGLNKVRSVGSGYPGRKRLFMRNRYL